MSACVVLWQEICQLSETSKLIILVTVRICCLGRRNSQLCFSKSLVVEHLTYFSGFTGVEHNRLDCSRRFFFIRTSCFKFLSQVQFIISIHFIISGCQVETVGDLNDRMVALFNRRIVSFSNGFLTITYWMNVSIQPLNISARCVMKPSRIRFEFELDFTQLLGGSFK